MKIRKVLASDLDAVMEIVDAARGIMRASGNMRQWTGGYPDKTVMTADIRTHRRGATALCHNPVRGAQRSVPGLNTPLLSACRRYATTPEPLPDRASGHAFS